MHKMIYLLLTCAPLLAIEIPSSVDFSAEPKISFQNAILAKANGKTISMMDVKKKMDMLFHQNYPNLADSNQARFQFYEVSWRHVLMEMIDNELIIADALEREIKLTDGEVREEMEERFGPNVMKTLDKIGLTYDETWKMVKNEMIVRRMSWWFVQSRAMQSITPLDIRQAYRLYLKENPSYQEWTYRVVSIRTDQSDDAIANSVYEYLKQTSQSPEAAANGLKQFETADAAIQVSNEFVAADKDLSDAHRLALAPLQPGDYSKPVFQKSRADKKSIYRIFYLSQKMDYPAPAFETMTGQLRNELMQKSMSRESQRYIEKLRTKYGFDTAHLKETVPDDLHPFSLQ